MRASRGIRLASASRYFLVALGASLLADAPLAAPLLVVNPGFEDVSGETPINEFTFGPLSGWDLYDPLSVTTGGEGPTYFIGTLTPFEPDPIGSAGVYAFFPAGAPEGLRVGIAFSFFGTFSVKTPIGPSFSKVMVS